MFKRLLSIGFIFSLVLVAQGCTDAARDLGIGVITDGEACLGTSQCVAGLTCEGETGAKTCAPLPELESLVPGSACDSDADCEGMLCGRQGVCTETQPKEAGATCGLSIDCVEGLVCNGVCGTCTSLC